MLHKIFYGGKEMSNEQVKVLMRKNNIYMWQVAKKIGIHETSFCKWFREELSQEQIQRILSAVEEIKLGKLKSQQSGAI